MDRRHVGASNGGRPWGPAVIGLAGAVALAVAAITDVAAQDLAAGQRVYEKANCVGCHRWHGGGGGGYGGAALSLRETLLDRDGLVETIRCGRPGTNMPYHERNAYREGSCFGLTAAELGSDMPPIGRDMLRPREIEAVADYVLALKERGEPTYEECVEFWGPGARECDAMR